MIRSVVASFGFLAWRGLVAASFFVWTLVRPGLRFISAVLVVAAVIALTMDVTRWQTGAGGPMFQSLENQIRAAAPATLEAIGKAISDVLHPLIWDPLLTTVLALPAWLFLLAVAAMLGYVTRERRYVNIFIN